MTKKINDDAMSSLLNGLSGGDAVPAIKGEVAEAKAIPQKVNSEKSSIERERICTLIESDVMSKVRAISEKEGLSIASIINLGLKVVVENYEKSHGKVKGSNFKKGKIDEVFNI